MSAEENGLRPGECVQDYLDRIARENPALAEAAEMTAYQMVYGNDRGREKYQEDKKKNSLVSQTLR